jgi:hypothetical protein
MKKSRESQMCAAHDQMDTWNISTTRKHGKDTRKRAKWFPTMVEVVPAHLNSRPVQIGLPSQCSRCLNAVSELAPIHAHRRETSKQQNFDPALNLSLAMER